MIRPEDFDLFTQKWEFVPQAVFRRPLSYFAELLKADIHEGVDDLDYYQGAAFTIKDAIPVVVMHYQGHPAGTTTMYLPFGFDDAELISVVINIVMHDFDIPAEAVSWRREGGGERLAS